MGETNLQNHSKRLTTWITLSKKRIVDSNTNNKNIQSGNRIEFGHTDNEKRKKTNNGKNKITKSRKNQNIQRKGTWEY